MKEHKLVASLSLLFRIHPAHSFGETKYWRMAVARKKGTRASTTREAGGNLELAESPAARSTSPRGTEIRVDYGVSLFSIGFQMFR